MDWIEKIMGVSPDGGNGTLELLLAFAVGLVIVTGIAAIRSGPRRALRKR
jgi:hypothetical protein